MDKHRMNADFFTKLVAMCVCARGVLLGLIPWFRHWFLGVNYFEWQWIQYGAIWCAVLIAMHTHMTGALILASDFGQRFSIGFVLCQFVQSSITFQSFLLCIFSLLATAERATKVDSAKMLFFHRMMATSLLFLPVFFVAIFFTNIKGNVPIKNLEWCAMYDVLVCTLQTHIHKKYALSVTMSHSTFFMASLWPSGWCHLVGVRHFYYHLIFVTFHHDFNACNGCCHCAHSHVEYISIGVW